MNTFVAKFGGTSLASSKEIRHIEQIASKLERRFVVVSAPGKRFGGDEKVTDILISCFEKAMKKVNYDEPFKKIKDRYVEIAKDLGVSVNLSSEFDAIKMNLDFDPNYDYILSRGEYLSAIIIAKYLHRKFIDPSQFMVMSNGGRVNIKQSKILFDKLVSNDEKYVIAGFYGRTKKGDIRIFSRGGSDITGAVVANLVNAQKYENFTDVDGVFDADPNFTKLAKKIDIMTYDEMYKMSKSGAKVLHPNCLKYLSKKNIVLNIRNTFNLADSGTLVVGEKYIKSLEKKK